MASASLPVESFGPTPVQPDDLVRIRRDMATAGAAMVSMRVNDDSDAGQLVRAFGRRLATGTGPMPDAPVDLIPIIGDMVDELASGARPPGDSMPHPATVTGIATHLRRVAMEAVDVVPGDRMAAPFPDRHTRLSGVLARCGAYVHASGVQAVEVGADFVVAGLTGFAERSPNDPEVADPYRCAARTVARQHGKSCSGWTGLSRERSSATAPGRASGATSGARIETLFRPHETGQPR